MAADGGVTAALASAKKTLNQVSRSNVDTSGQHAWSKPSYSHAHASRKMAALEASSKPAEAPTGLSKEAADAGAGIKSRMETEAAARKSLEQ